MLLLQRVILFAGLITTVLGAWDALYSPSSPYAYIRLQTNEIVPIYIAADENVSIEDQQAIDTVIDPPTSGNYSLALANSELFALYPGDGDKLRISQLNSTSKGWNSISYNTTLKSNIEYYEGSTIMASNDVGEDYQSVYIYGGVYNGSVTDRLLEFNPNTKRLNEIVSSVSPTSFYGAGSSVMDSEGTSNIVIGGKADNGWVSMFQVAIWEYRAWTFKAVSDSSFSVNSRVNPLVLPVFDNNTVDSFLVIGGELGDDFASPYVMSLNIANEWKWSNMTSVGEFDIDESLGGVVINNTLVSVSVSNSKKRDEPYMLKLYDVKNFESVDVLNVQSVKDAEASSTASSDEPEASSSSSSASSVTATSSSSSSASNQGKTTEADEKEKQKTIGIAVSVSLVSLAIVSLILYIIFKKFQKSPILMDNSSGSDSSSNTADYFKEISDLDNQSISSWNFKRDEYERGKIASTANTATITFEEDHNNASKPRKSVDQFTFEQLTSSGNAMGKSAVAQPLKKLKNIYKSPSLSLSSNIHQSPPPQLKFKKSHSAFADPEDYQDRHELSMSYQTNRSKVSIFSNSGDSDNSSTTDISNISAPEKVKRKSSNYNLFDQEEEKIDEFLNNRDVQVLVSSKRRSKLRITNPDISNSDNDLDNENNSQRSHSGSNSGSLLSDELQSYAAVSDGLPLNDLSDVGLPDIDNEKEYFDDVLKVFDEELDLR
jgi:hypothetical protein